MSSLLAAPCTYASGSRRGEPLGSRVTQLGGEGSPSQSASSGFSPSPSAMWSMQS